MARRASVAERVAGAMRTVLRVEDLPIRLRAWDGSEAGPAGAPLVVVRSRCALRRIVWAPGELGLARAYVSGEIDVEDDLTTAFAMLSSAGRLEPGANASDPTLRERLDLLRTAVQLRVVGPNPAPPPEEIQVATAGRLHSRARDAKAVSSHYDVGNDFYRMVLGPSMVYSCAVWETEDAGLDAAQENKLDLICRKLGLAPGMRMLDVGCGWGSLALHAAREYAAQVVGITLSEQQALLARKRVDEAGLTDRVEIRVQDYREVVDGPFDAIASVGMAEHVGRGQLPIYAARLCSLLRPGGRLLNHAISWNAGETIWAPDSFIARYVFPDGELISLSDMLGILEGAGLEALDVEALRRHYGLTLRAWVRNLEQYWDEAVEATSEGRARAWRLYMTGSALAFDDGTMGLNQVLLQRPGGDPPPLRRTGWV